LIAKEEVESIESTPKKIKGKRKKKGFKMGSPQKLSFFVCIRMAERTGQNLDRPSHRIWGRGGTMREEAFFFFFGYAFCHGRKNCRTTWKSTKDIVKL
jgi:hypothetical protein